MTEAELKAILSTLTKKSFQNILASGGAGQQEQFVDTNRSLLLAKYPASSGEGRAIRNAYELIDQGFDPVDVAQRVMAANEAGEYDMSQDSVDEITKALGEFGSAKAKFDIANPAKSPVDVLKDLGLQELSPLLGSLTSDTALPVGLKQQGADPAFQRALLAANERAKGLRAAAQKAAKPEPMKSVQIEFPEGVDLPGPFNITAGSKTPKIPSWVLKAASTLGNLPKYALPRFGGGALGVAALPLAMGEASRDVDKFLTPEPDKTKEWYAKLLEKQAKKDAQTAKSGIRYQERMNKAYNDAYMKEFARLQEEQAKKPSAFDVQRAALLRALNG
jgi:hypothetical protein